MLFIGYIEYIYIFIGYISISMLHILVIYVPVAWEEARHNSYILYYTYKKFPAVANVMPIIP